MLIDYSKYAEAVTEAYEARPVVDSSSELRSWEALKQSNDKMFKRLSGVIEVVWTTDDPYQSQSQMKKEVEQSGKIFINTEYSDNLASGWSKEDNWKFRAVHDYIVHIGGDVSFGQRGEIQAFNVHAKIAPPAALDALFSEVVGQACGKYYHLMMDVPSEARGKELTVEDMESFGAKVQEFKIEAVWN